MDLGFKIDPIWKQKEVVGLDIGTKNIKVVQLKQKGKLTKLIGYGQVAVPENFIIEGIIAEPEKLAVIIKELFKDKVWGKVDGTRVNASLPESKIFTRILTLPRMTEKEREEAIYWEASQSVPMALSDLNLDWQVIGPDPKDPKNDEILFAAAPKSIVNSYMMLFRELNMQPVGLETNLSAVARAMISEKAKTETALIVDMGGQTTNLAVFDQIIRVTGSTPVGGEHLSQKIADALKIDIKEAERIKVSKVVENQKVIREAIDSEVTEITREIDRMISYYGERAGKENPIKKIILSGGSACLPGLTEILAEKVGLPTVIGNPWANISIYPIKSVPKNEVPAYTNAVGLSLIGVKDE